MLNSADSECRPTLPQIPYRLPSRRHTFAGTNDSSYSDRFSGISGYRNPVSRAYTCIAGFVKSNEDSNLEPRRMRSLHPDRSPRNDGSETKGVRPKTTNGNLINLYNSRLTNVENLLTNSQRLLWIDELKQWIVEEPSIIEFLRLSKKSTIFDTEIMHVNMSKIRNQVEIEFCQRMSKRINNDPKKIYSYRIERPKTLETQRIVKSQYHKPSQKKVLTPTHNLDKHPRQNKVRDEAGEKLLRSKSDIPIKTEILDAYSILVSNHKESTADDKPSKKPNNYGFENQFQDQIEEKEPLSEVAPELHLGSNNVYSNSVKENKYHSDRVSAGSHSIGSTLGLNTTERHRESHTTGSTLGLNTTELHRESHNTGSTLGLNTTEMHTESFDSSKVEMKPVRASILVQEAFDSDRSVTGSLNLDIDNQARKKKDNRLRRQRSEQCRTKPNLRPRVSFNLTTTEVDVEEVEMSDHRSSILNVDDDESDDSDDSDDSFSDYSPNTNDTRPSEEISVEAIEGRPPIEITEVKPDIAETKSCEESPSAAEIIVEPIKGPPPIEITEVKREIMAPLLSKPKLRWGKKQIDTSYRDQLEKERLAEIRRMKIRKKLQMAIDKNKRDKIAIIPEGPRYETYGFLAKYCILKKINVGLYRNTFDVCDENRKQWLTEDELMMALKGVNPDLKSCDFAHMALVLKTIDYDMRKGADFKLFSVLAALSIRITELDSWIKSFVGASDFEQMKTKIRYCKTLWECLVDPGTNTMPVKSLCVELRAGGVTKEHIDEVRYRFREMTELSLMDFLTYIPLFVMIHTSIIDNPLETTQRI